MTTQNPELVSQHEAGYRTYEVYMRERVGQSTSLLKPGQLRSAQFTTDPYPLLTTLREHYPCYRDWHGNSFWISRYDDVTSVLTDDASFETRPRRRFYAPGLAGRDLGDSVPVRTSQVASVDRTCEPLVQEILSRMVASGRGDLAVDLAARLPIELLVRTLAVPVADRPRFVAAYVRMHRGAHWEPKARREGAVAAQELTAYFDDLLDARRKDPGDDVVSAIAALELEDGPACGEDVVVTLLEADHQTLHGALANLWFLLLTHPDQLEQVAAERRFVKSAYLEAIRHSTPVLTADRFTTREVERFGRLLPLGALVVCAQAGANRDPRVFRDPDDFVVQRKDLCQREARGQYRADGLASGIAFGLGPPTKHPAVPTDRPRSPHAVTRDLAVTASNLVLDLLPDVRLAPGAEPTLRSLRYGDVFTCWSLPVTFGSA